MKEKKVKMGKSRTLAGVRGSEQESEEERVDSTVNKGRFQGGNEDQVRASLGDVEGSMSG